MVSAPSCSSTSNLRSARRRLAAQHVRRDRLEVVERLVEVDREAEVGAPLPHLRAATSGDAIRSSSTISTPSNPAAAAAASLSSSVPDRQTVAMVSLGSVVGWSVGGCRWRCGSAVSIGCLPAGVRVREGVEVAEHPAGSGSRPVMMPERVGGLEDGHPAAVEDAAAAVPCRARAARSPAAGRRCRRPTAPVSAARRAPAGRDGPPCPSGWRARDRPRPACTRRARSASSIGDRPSRAEPGGQRPSTSVVARRGSTSKTWIVPAPRDSRACATAGARPARAEQDDRVEHGVREPVAHGAREPGQVGVVPDGPAVGEHDGVDRADRRGLGGQLVEVVEHQLLDRMGDVEPVVARRAARRPPRRRPPRRARRGRRGRGSGTGNGVRARRPPARAVPGSATCRCRSRSGRRGSSVSLRADAMSTPLWDSWRTN